MFQPASLTATAIANDQPVSEAQAPAPHAAADADAAATPAAAPALSDDARLYLRHVEGGELIRALSRELGCHASTVLRRIRRFEQRRDDPLVDQALTRAANDPARQDQAQITRCLRRLAEPGAVLAVADGMEKAIVTRDDIRTAYIDARLAEQLALNGWVAAVRPTGGRIHRYVIVPAGREALRAMLRAGQGGLPAPQAFVAAQPVAPGDQGPAHAQQHRVFEQRVIQDPEDGRRRRARVNIAESPLLLLARRRGPDGKPFLSPAMIAAAERLREDFELAHLGPRVAQNWDRFLTSGIDVSASSGGYRGGSEGARDRVALALRELGPGMGDLALRVCCYLDGLEQTERRLGWSARSGKVVLRLALERLSRHYEAVYGKGTPLIG